MEVPEQDIQVLTNDIVVLLKEFGWDVWQLDILLNVEILFQVFEEVLTDVFGDFLASCLHLQL